MRSFHIESLYQFLLSRHRKLQFEKVIFFSAAIFFVIHFLFVFFIRIGVLSPYLYDVSGRIPSPISTIYTPFTIILLYEVYLLIYYLPKSIASYLGKQYEIITLILIRGIFDRLARFPVKVDNTNLSSLSELLITFAGLIILLLLIFCFYKLARKKDIETRTCEGDEETERFVSVKKIISICLLFVFIYLFIRSVLQLPGFSALNVRHFLSLFKDLNDSFFSIFFSALILTEVLLLLFMYNLSDKFNKVFRNSGFIISTILLKLSFRAEGISNLIIILISVLFGVIIMALYRLFERKL